MERRTGSSTLSHRWRVGCQVGRGEHVYPVTWGDQTESGLAEAYWFWQLGGNCDLGALGSLGAGSQMAENTDTRKNETSWVPL